MRRPRKALVVHRDGTWNSARQAQSTDVARIADVIAPEDAAGRWRIVYCHDRVGTTRYERLRGGLSGIGLSRMVEDAHLPRLDRERLPCPLPEVEIMGPSRRSVAETVAEHVRLHPGRRRADALHAYADGGRRTVPVRRAADVVLDAPIVAGAR